MITLAISFFFLAHRLADDEEDHEKPPRQDVEKQRAELNKRLGLDVAAKLGVKTDHIFTNEDLATHDPERKPGKTDPSPPTTMSGMSSREKNRLKRALSKQKSQQAAAAKRKKYSPRLYKAPVKKEGEEDDGGWPLEGFCSHLLSDLFEKRWESRHGAATALREVVRLRGEGAGRWKRKAGSRRGSARATHLRWLEDAALRLVSVVARDRFGDFVSDAVVAPVRESAAQALGSVVGLMPAPDALRVAGLLLELLREEGNWQCRHGGLLGVSIVVVARVHRL